MESSRQNPFIFSALDDYSFRQRIAIRAADIVFSVFLFLLGTTLRWSDEDEAFLRSVDSQRPVILCVWHAGLLPSLFRFRRMQIVALTSKSFDGEYTARCLQRFGFGSVRGSSSRGGGAALLALEEQVDQGRSIAFTVDGPKGPARVVKPGACVLAKRSGAPIIPFSVALSSFWRLGSWDRMMVPKPFSKARLVFGPQIKVASDADDNIVSEKIAELQRALDSLD